MSKKELTLDDLRFPMVVKWEDMVYYIEEDGSKLHWCHIHRKGAEWFLNNIGKDILGKDNLLGYLNKGLAEILASPPIPKKNDEPLLGYGYPIGTPEECPVGQDSKVTQDYSTYPKTSTPLALVGKL